MEAEEIDMSGKGSKRRPYSVDSETFASNWDRAFSRSNHESSQEPVMPCDEPEEFNQTKDQQ